MSKSRIFILTTIIILAATAIIVFAQKETFEDQFITYTIDPHKQEIKLYWKDDTQENFKSIQNLKSWLYKKNKTLVFAMNAGMYKPDNSSQGLFIENGKTLSPLDTTSGTGNFYLKPNGVFYITTNDSPAICNTTNFINNGRVKYATQSGPMLVINGQIHAAFKEGSGNLNIRNGVGILPGNKVIFAMSKKAINFYNFANFFKSMGCEYALYLDGLVSQTYLPQKNRAQTGGDFGVIIGVATVIDK